MLATLPTDKNSFAYISQHGSLQEINAYLGNEFLREQCQIGPKDVNNYLSQKCPTAEFLTNPHLNSKSASFCRDKALIEVSTAKECIRSAATRTSYQANTQRLQSEALAIKQIQIEKAASEAQFKRDLNNVKNSCDYHLSQLKVSMAAYLMPFAFVATEALLSKPQRVQAFNDCVERETRGKQELRDSLLKSSTGLIQQISRTFQPLKCYKEVDRKTLQCEIAMSVLSGGAGLSVFAIKKLGRGAESTFNKRVRRRAGESPSTPLVVKRSQVLQVTSCLPQDCQLSTIRISDEFVTHTESRHLLTSGSSTTGLTSRLNVALRQERVQELYRQRRLLQDQLENTELARRARGQLNRQIDNLTNDTREILSEELGFDNLHRKRMSSFLPKGTSVDGLISSIPNQQITRLRRSPNGEATLYQFELDKRRYEMWVCRKPPCLRDGTVITQPDEMLTLYPVCGPGITILKSLKRIDQFVFRRNSGRDQLSRENVYNPQPCTN